MYISHTRTPTHRNICSKVVIVFNTDRHDLIVFMFYCRRQRLRDKIGSRQRVIIEGLSQESDLLLQGRCDFQAPEIDGLTYITEIDGDITPGIMVEAEIYDTNEFDLFARVV